MENDEIRKYITNNLKLTGDRMHDALILMRKISEMDECKSFLDSMKKENEVAMLKQWAEELEHVYGRKVTTSLTGAQPMISLTIPYNGQEDAITVLVEDIRNVLYCAIMPVEGHAKQFDEMLTWARPLLDTVGSFKRGQNWLLWKAISYETGLKDMKDIIDVLCK